MLETLFDIQRDIHSALGAHLGQFAENRDWMTFAAFLPLGIVFGAVHALTPGHSKAVLATYLAGSSLGVARSLLVSLALSLTHVGMAVLIALLSLPVLSRTLDSVGRAPLLEDLSRGLLGLIGLWMLARAFRREPHVGSKGQGALAGFVAGLVPCPLTLFAMTFAMLKGVPEAGLAFAATMAVGIALTLSAVAAVTVLCRQSVTRLIEDRPATLEWTVRGLQAAAGLVLIAIAALELSSD